jgi:hypothetical protein
MRWAAAAVCSLLCLVCVTTASGGVAPRILVGVADDTGKYADGGGGSFFAQVSSLGLSVDRMTVTWDPARPLTIIEAPFLDRSIAEAATAGIAVVLGVRPVRAGAVGTSVVKARHFAAFVAALAARYPQVKTFVIGNEPNQPRFWQPQFVQGREVAALGYERMLAACYDRLKAVDPAIAVAGGVVSSRGNDSASARSNSSTSPVRFIAGLGAAYRASGRADPIMDVFAFHPYPRSNRDTLEHGLQWPDAGFANLDRVKQALWDAFHGTGQPTVEGGLRISLDEVGWQVAIPAGSADAYYGTETVAVASERAQARVYAHLIAHAECDPSIANVLFLPFIDETQLSGFQSGLERADGTKRPAYYAVRSALARGTACSGALASWHHTTSVVGAQAFFATVRRTTRSSWALRLRTAEDVTYQASVVSVSPARRLTAAAALALHPVLTVHGYAHASWTPRVVFPRSPLRPGRYAFVLILRAALAPERKSAFVSRTFGVP